MKVKNTRDTMSDTYLDALRIRNEVFVKGQGIDYTIEMGSPLEEAMSVHFVLYDDENKACATCRLLSQENPETVLLQRMAVLKEERGKNYASFLLADAVHFAKGHGISQILLHAQLSACGFYEKTGFKSLGEVFEEAGIKHITMSKAL